MVYRVMMGFQQKRSKKSYFNSISRITRPASHFWILRSAKIAMPVVVCLNEQYPVIDLRFKKYIYIFIKKFEHSQ